ncbi:MAG TPA: T9SS type A sorting domain-containing protein [Flavobacteriales bacterium]|nr:T9SS type A sorting domain-containing protein [Flavobacteriales bacterium]
MIPSLRGLLLTSLLLPTSSAFALTLFLQVQNETCSYANGSVNAAVTGGVPPYTYLWGGGETTASITGLSEGTYSVTVTDFVGTQVSDQADVISENYAPISDFTQSYCPGQNYHAFFMPMPPPGLSGDFGPYTVSQGVIGNVPPPAMDQLYLDLGQLAPGTGFDVSYWDANGCPGQLSGISGAPNTSWPSIGVMAVEGSCANQNTGSITFSWLGTSAWDTYPILRQPGDAMYWFNNSWNNIDTYMGRFSDLAPGDYWLMFSLALTASLVQDGGMCVSDSVLVTVPDLGSSCGVISGSTYMDYNSDCIDGEANASNLIVEIQPGPYYASSSGGYSATVPNGSYTLTTTGAAVAQSCPAASTVNGNHVFSNIGHQPTIPLDVAIGLASGPARPGFELHYNMIVQNLSSSASGATTTTLTFDPTVTFTSAWPTPTSVVGGVITWNQPSLDIFQEREYQVHFHVPSDVGLIGTELIASASVNTANMDGDLANNIAGTSVIITSSFDPNDKLASTSSRLSNNLYYIDEDQWIDYVIHFQNTGTDTAFNVVVTDTLPSSLDPSTISLVTASHSHQWNLGGQGVLRVVFPNILLPDSNVNEGTSHGLISFRVRPRQPLLPGTSIENVANIFFDFNDPVITEPSVLTAEFSTGGAGDEASALSLSPVPVSDLLRITTEGPIEMVVVLAADGREVMRRTVRAANGSIDVSSLRAGSYFLLATMNNGSLVRERFIKQ